MAPPRYQDLVAFGLPVAREDGVDIRVFSGAYNDTISPTLNHLPITMLEVRLDGRGLFGIGWQRATMPSSTSSRVWSRSGATVSVCRPASSAG
jgi:redox-sensitive bicupin YhaK (pirin superfamily)